MGSNNEEKQVFSRQGAPKRARSLSESLKGLFKQQSSPPVSITNTIGSRDGTAPPSPVSESGLAQGGLRRRNSRSGKLGKLASNKEAELSSYRGVPPSQHHPGLPHIGKLSLGYDQLGSATTPVDNGAVSPRSSLSEEEDLSQLRRLQTPEMVPEEPGDSESIREYTQSPPRSGSASSADSARRHRNISPISAGIDRNPKTSIDAALENDSRYLNNGKNGHLLKRSSSFKKGDNSSSSSLSSKGVYSKSRRRAGTVSASSLSKYSESDSKCILQVENFKVYENGTHEHNLKVTPLVSEGSDKSSDSLMKQKSTFSLSQFFKPRKEDNKLLESAVSLIPIQSYHRYNYDSAGADSNNYGSDTDNESAIEEEDMSDIKNKPKLEESQRQKTDEENFRTPKIVNPDAAVGSEELKLINTLSEKIHKSFRGKISKTHTLIEGHISRRIEPSEEDEKQGSKFFEMYGRPIGLIGHGAYGTVKVCAKPKSSKDLQPLPTFSNGRRLFFGVKELRPKPTDPIEKFSTRITSEFIIGHSLSRCQKDFKNAPNILKILDLMECQDSFIEVMEFCPSGDLYNLLTRKSKAGTVLHPIEADCFMKQLLHGVQFMHMHGIAHCDLKPENILFYPNGLLKICDFGTSCVFQTAWEKHVHFQTGTMGSEPYVAPEEFNLLRKYDPRLADCWSCGVVYCTMVLGHYLWKVAMKGQDVLFDKFCRQMTEEGKFSIFEELRHANSEINRLRKIALYHVFQVDPKKRITVDELLQSPWMRRTKCCAFYSREKSLMAH